MSALLFTVALVLASSYVAVATVGTFPFSCGVAIVGAGPGGLYTAWRLATSRAVDPAEICVFEKESRVGGRVYTLTSLPGVPELNGYYLDMGAHRYNPISEYLTASLVNALRVNTTCYPATASCVPQPGSYFLRNTPLAADAPPDDWPYKFLQGEWSPGSSQPLPENLVFAIYPFIFNYFANLTSTDPAIKWKAVSDVLNMVKNFPVGTAQNLQAGNLNARVAFGDIYSSEVWQAAIDTEWSGSSWVYQLNFFWAIREVVAQIAGTGYPYVVPTGGYSAWVEKMATQFTAAGGKIYYNYKLESINPGLLFGIPTLQFSNGISIVSNKVLLNLPPHSIKELSGTLTPFRSPYSNDVLTALNGVFNIHSAFVYVYYEDAWWANALGRPQGAIVSTEMVRAVSYGDHQLPKSNGKLAGWITAYITGDDNSAFFRQASLDNRDVLTVLNRTNNGRALLSLIHSNLMKIHQNFFAAKNIDPSTVAGPTKGIVANWNPKNFGGFHATQPSPFDPSYILKLYQKPVQGTNIFYVNEATSPRNGWAEGSLIMAEKFLANQFRMSRPTWLNSAWYDFWIKQDV